MERGGASMLHLDVMDGHFVPNLTIGPPWCSPSARPPTLTLDVHLMITDPDRYAPVFVEAGANCVSVHQEACPHLDRTLRRDPSEGAQAGVVLNPATPSATLEDVLELVDYVLIMSVNPGFGGQEVHPARARQGAPAAPRARAGLGHVFRHRDRRRRDAGEPGRCRPRRV